MCLMSALTNDETMQIIKYGLVGVIGTGAHYLILFLGVEYVGVTVLIATSLGFIVGGFINHHFNKKYTFSSDRSYSETLLKSLVVATLMFVVNLGLMMFLVEYAAVFYLFSQVITTLIVFILGFILNKYTVFLAKGV